MEASTFDKQITVKITVFFILAFGISYFLNLLPNPLLAYGIKTNLNCALGPFLAAILVSIFHKTPLRLKLLSETSWIRNVELIGLAIFFVGSFLNATKTGNANYSLIIFSAIFALVYTLLEEAGWRVFLGNELVKYSQKDSILIKTWLDPDNAFSYS